MQFKKNHEIHKLVRIKVRSVKVNLRSVKVRAIKLATHAVNNAVLDPAWNELSRSQVFRKLVPQVTCHHMKARSAEVSAVYL